MRTFRMLVGFAVLLVLGLVAAGTVCAKPAEPTGYAQYLHLPNGAEWLRGVYKQGIKDGNNSDVFAKLGGSTTESREFAYYLGTSAYNLGEYSYLEDTRSYFAVHTVPINRSNPHNDAGNSFTRLSYGGRNGLVLAQIATVMQPTDYPYYVACDGRTNMQCEYDTIQPSIVLLWFGINEPFENMPADEFKRQYADVIEHTLDRNIIPVIGTIGKNCYTLYGNNGNCYTEVVAAYNGVIRELAAEYRIPLIDFGGALEGLPNQGMSADNLHPSSPTPISLTATFDVPNLQYGYTARNLLTLMMLDELRTVLNAK